MRPCSLLETGTVRPEAAGQRELNPAAFLGGFVVGEGAALSATHAALTVVDNRTNKNATRITAWRLCVG